MEERFSLYDLIINNNIKGLIFDKYGQKHHLRLFPYKMKLFGSFEAYIAPKAVNVRHQTKILRKLILTSDDKKVILYAFLHRESLGIADGMRELSGPMDTNQWRNFSPGTYEDNYLFSNDILLQLYDEIDSLEDRLIPLPQFLNTMLSLNMETCYFDKVPIKGTGSICINCAKELRSEGYNIPDSFVAYIKKEK